MTTTRPIPTADRPVDISEIPTRLAELLTSDPDSGRSLYVIHPSDTLERHSAAGKSLDNTQRAWYEPAYSPETGRRMSWLLLERIGDTGRVWVIDCTPAAPRS